MWIVYILRCSDSSLYTGITSDIERRVTEHNSSEKLGAKYTKTRRPVTLVHSESYQTRSEALKREWQIKKLSRIAKLSLLSSSE